jgi:hypothetical protein
MSRREESGPRSKLDIGIMLLIGNLMGAFFMSQVHTAEEDTAHQRGYQEGRASCSQPSRLEKGAKAAAHWLTEPGR